MKLFTVRSVLLAGIFAMASLLLSSSASALPIDKYSLDVEITNAGAAGPTIGVGVGDIFLMAGRVEADLASVTGTGVELANLLDFNLTLGTESWTFMASPVATVDFGLVSSPNLVEYTNGFLSRIHLKSISTNGLLLELDGTFSTTLVGSMSLMVDNFAVGEVVGLYSANPIPEPSAAMLFLLATGIAAQRTRRS
jgi:hypothetical protein